MSRSATQMAGASVGRRVDRKSCYRDRWRDAFDEAASDFLASHVAVLDIGSGRQPTISRADRPAGCRYVGLDISKEELRLAGAEAYDEIVVRDIATTDPSLFGEFDLALSWQVLEHVRSLDAALANIYAYLRPGGAFVAQLSGKFSAFALVNQLIPSRVGVAFLDRLLSRERGTVFPAYYDRCYATALARTFDDWSDLQIMSRFRGADYFAFSPRLRRLCLRYEAWAMRGGHDNLATHYLLVARK